MRARLLHGSSFYGARPWKATGEARSASFPVRFWSLIWYGVAGVKTRTRGGSWATSPMRSGRF
jgi:hypothetical protein